VTVTAVRLGGRPDQPLLVLGPALGTSATALWSAAAHGLAQHFHVVSWDLPGHGHNRLSSTREPVSIETLAADVLAVVDELREGGGSTRFHYAGDSVGGAVGLQLALDAPDQLASATVLCSGARIGSPDLWAERASQVRSAGTPSLVAESAGRWFAPGFLEREPERASALLHALADTDDEGYAAVCDALARFDLRARLTEVEVSVLAVAGDRDRSTPTSSLAEVAEGVARGRLVVLRGVGHLAPVEAPAEVGRLVREHALGHATEGPGETSTRDGARAAGMAVRREVLGDAHVDRATAAATDLTRDFQEFITEYAWGGIWTRPGLDRRSRSLITLTALVARGHQEELAMHIRAARTNGVTVEEIKELLLQTAIYCGVPDANTAFHTAQKALDGLGES